MFSIWLFYRCLNRHIYFQQFNGNDDNNTIVLHYVPLPAMLTSIHVIPAEWENNFAIRLELYGCIAGKYWLVWFFKEMPVMILLLIGNASYSYFEKYNWVRSRSVPA